MPSLGPAEILVIIVIALLVFGPDKMPDMARQAGRAFREFRRVQQHLRSEISGAISDLDGSSSTPSPDDATSGAASSTTAPGGDPVPMLPPKDPDVRQPDAQPPPPGVTGSSSAPPSTQPPVAQPSVAGPSAPDLGSAPGPTDPV